MLTGTSQRSTMARCIYPPLNLPFFRKQPNGQRNITNVWARICRSCWRLAVYQSVSQASVVRLGRVTVLFPFSRP